MKGMQKSSPNLWILASNGCLTLALWYPLPSQSITALLSIPKFTFPLKIRDPFSL